MFAVVFDSHWQLHCYQLMWLIVKHYEIVNFWREAVIPSIAVIMVFSWALIWVFFHLGSFIYYILQYGGPW